jgi:hypothetical protein
MKMEDGWRWKWVKVKVKMKGKSEVAPELNFLDD